MRRRRYTEKEKRNLVEKFERSGASAWAFCRKHKVSCESLRRWRLAVEATKGAGEPTRFVELEVESGRLEAARPVAGPAVELDFGGGMILRIYRGHGQ